MNSEARPPTLTGFLVKRGHVIKNWKLRYFKLENGKLSYYEGGDRSYSEAGRTLKGTVDLTNALCGGRSVTDPLKIYIVDTVTEKDLYIRTNSAEEAALWESHILQHIHFARSQSAKKKHGGAAGSSAQVATVLYNDSSEEDDVQEEDIEQRLTRSGAILMDVENYGETNALRQVSCVSSLAETEVTNEDMAAMGSLSKLLIIAKEIKLCETENKRVQDDVIKEFNKTSVPVLKVTLKDLDARIKVLRKRITSETDRGDEHVLSLEEELERLISMHNEQKCKMLFPHSTFSAGSAGVYCAIDDFWLEKISGKFDVQLLPPEGDQKFPQLIVLLSGAAGSLETDLNGVSALLQIWNFKLKGDANKGVPPLSFSSLQLAITFSLTLLLTYNADTKRWTAPAEHFKISILRFKGPFGISRGVISTILALVVPILKHFVLKLLPPEIGLLINSLPSPTKIAGEFNIKNNLTVDSINNSFALSDDLCAALGVTPHQMKLFLHMQKSMKATTIMASLCDLVEYKHFHEKNHNWEHLKGLWNQAILSYFSELEKSSGRAQSEVIISFHRLMDSADRVNRNPLGVSVTLRQLELSIGLKSLLCNSRAMCQRLLDSATAIRKKDKAHKDQVQMLAEVLEILQVCDDILEVLATSIDYLELTAGVDMTSGSKGELRVLLREVAAQAPLAIWLSLPHSYHMGFDYIVPMMIDMKSGQKGHVNIKVLQVGSTDMLESMKFAQFKNSLRDGVASTSTPLSRLFGSSESSKTTVEADRFGDSTCDGNKMRLEAIQTASYEQYKLAARRPVEAMKRVLRAGPGPMEAHEIMHVRIERLQVLFTLAGGEAVSLSPGAALFMLQMGPADAQKLSSTAAPDYTMLASDDFMLEGAEKIDPEDKCSIKVQTASKVKVKANIPDIRVRIQLPALLRFIMGHFEDKDRLVRYLATMFPKEREEIAKMLDLFRQTLSIASKLLLLSNELNLSLAAAVTVVSSEHEGLVISVRPPQHATAPATHVVKFNARVDVWDLIKDAQILMKMVPSNDDKSAFFGSDTTVDGPQGSLQAK